MDSSTNVRAAIPGLEPGHLAFANVPAEEAREGAVAQVGSGEREKGKRAASGGVWPLN